MRRGASAACLLAFIAACEHGSIDGAPAGVVVVASCPPAPFDATVCWPSVVAPHTASTIDLTISGAPRGALIGPCTVEVRGLSITLVSRVTSCSDAGSALIGTQSCAVPPIAPGRYFVEVAGQRTPTRPSRVLVVDADPDAGAASGITCDAAKLGPYDRTCHDANDAECVAITAPDDVCVPCACPNQAIRADQRARYEDDYRAALARCPAREPVSCAPCPPMRAACHGSCELEPTN